MVDIIGVRFKEVGKIYYFAPGEFDIQLGDHVIVETARGIEFGEVVVGKKQIPEEDVIPPLKNVIRLATEEDEAVQAQNKEKEKDAYKICLEKIKKHNMEMKLIEVEYTFDGNKILFYFTADGRIDFRELVKDLAVVFKTRIELRQIGVRDEAKSLGSVGICGRPLCCSSFLGEFDPVSIRMAKEQGLSLNPTKISGACGRLMCCLKYEQNTYEDLLKKTPRVGYTVKTPAGQGTVESVSILKGLVKVKIEGGKEKAFQEFAAKDVKVLKRMPREGCSGHNGEKVEGEMRKNLEEK
jgi:cell fate regulator YaaT (PSP1 superfamily)